MSYAEATTRPDTETAGRPDPDLGARPRTRDRVAGTPTEHLEAELTSLTPDASADAYRPTGRAKWPIPSLAQPRVDALVHLLDSTGHTDSKGAGRRRSIAEVILHVRPEGNTLSDGTPLSDHAVGKLLPDAFVSLLMQDNRRHPIDASPRRRFPTRRQRRVIDERDPECGEDGCHAQAFLQYDHIQPYPQGGLTILDNLQRLCGPHNRAKNP